MPLCFAIMPISMPDGYLEKYNKNGDHFVKVAQYLFKPAAEQAGYEFRQPKSTSAEIIQAEIIKNLDEADLVLCDMSTWNANVFFELGIRVALNKPVAMVKDDQTSRVPFDNAMINAYTYKSDLQVWTVESEVGPLADFLKTAGAQDKNAMWKYFGIEQQAQQPDPENPEDAKLTVMLDLLRSMDKRLAGVETGQLKSRNLRSQGISDRLQRRMTSSPLSNHPALLGLVRDVQELNQQTRHRIEVFDFDFEERMLTIQADVAPILSFAETLARVATNWFGNGITLDVISPDEVNRYQVDKSGEFKHIGSTERGPGDPL